MDQMSRRGSYPSQGVVGCPLDWGGDLPGSSIAVFRVHFLGLGEGIVQGRVGMSVGLGKAENMMRFFYAWLRRGRKMVNWEP